MKSVMISIQPYWVFLIIAKAMGWKIEQHKEIEVRKTYPKADDWNKVAKIYCSKDKKSFDKIPEKYRPAMSKFLGKVIGEFVCDSMYGIFNFLPYEADDTHHDTIPYVLEQSCLQDYEIDEYLGAKDGYGWHISDIVIYDEPKGLGEFKTICRDAYCLYGYGETPTWYCKDGYGSCAITNKEITEYPYNEECIYFDCPQVGGESCEYEDFAYCLCNGLKPITRPPQSWCYVEEKE